MTSIIDDLQKLTNIPKSSLEQLVDKVNYIISHAVFESMKSKENFTEIDVGIGFINILHEGDCIKYKFIPSSTLEKRICSTIRSDESPLIDKVESTLQQKVMNVYKTLF